MTTTSEKTKPKGGNLRASGKHYSLTGNSGANGNPASARALELTRFALALAIDQLDRYSLTTDDPALGVPEAADLLDAVRDLLTDGARPEMPALAGWA